jgi:hypothetical protein
LGCAQRLVGVTCNLSNPKPGFGHHSKGRGQETALPETGHDRG